MSDIKASNSDYTYKIQGNVIYPSIKDGVIESAYQAVSIDDEGYPLIPDNAHLQERQKHT